MSRTLDESPMQAQRFSSEKGKIDPLEHYKCGRLTFADSDNYDRHLVFDHAISHENASHRERFEAVACALRDLMTQRWLLTDQTYNKAIRSSEFTISRWSS